MSAIDFGPTGNDTHGSRRSEIPPCSDHPDDWDLDIGTPAAWHRAVETCHRCPLLDGCGRLAQTLLTRGAPPRSMIWAGVAYDGMGRVIENLHSYGGEPAKTSRPSVIVRNPRVVAPAPTAEVKADVPRRHLVIGRREAEKVDEASVEVAASPQDDRTQRRYSR